MAKATKRTETIKYELGKDEEMVAVICITKKDAKLHANFLYGGGIRSSHPHFMGARQGNVDIGAILAKLSENFAAMSFEETLNYIEEMKIDIATLLE